jgi:hypothetical protein
VFEVGPQPGNALYRRYTNIYAQRGGQWRLIARQATLIQPRSEQRPQP